MRVLPLEDKMRPKKIEDMVGQRHIIGKGKVLNKIIENKSIPNMILYLSLIHICTKVSRF